jgi:protein-disulfide isomerase
MHKNAQLAAEAGQCANAQNKFWEYHDMLFQNQRALAAEDLKQYAATLGLDADKFNQCLDSGSMREAVAADQAEATALGIRGTPAFYINGRFLSGAQPFEKFQAIIDDELQRKGVETGTS